MKAVKVQYTVRESYVKNNAENISQVMADLRKLNNPGIKYSAFLLEDKKSFVHFVITDEKANHVLSELDSFKKFQSELKANLMSHQVDHLNLIGSSYDF
jgi:hypothetical protein